VILEVAILDVITGKEIEFEAAFGKAQSIISSMEGYISHELKRCIEKDTQYILLVNWETLESHTKGFRESAQYKLWQQELHHFYDPMPVVEHYESVY
jgi:heme-degrading monooxygenase HmoA